MLKYMFHVMCTNSKTTFIGKVFFLVWWGWTPDVRVKDVSYTCQVVCVASHLHSSNKTVAVEAVLGVSLAKNTAVAKMIINTIV